ncbi:hypothetical protein B0H13DRAFT_1927164 [Mycena leptocephala]|nr:hypothetical protein B0H13DRAFT_1927164 [Mycena leptocephala]
MWMLRSPLLFLVISIITFLAGLVLFSFRSSQVSYLPMPAPSLTKHSQALATSLATAISTAITSFGLGVITLWMTYGLVVFQSGDAHVTPLSPLKRQRWTGLTLTSLTTVKHCILTASGAMWRALAEIGRDVSARTPNSMEISRRESKSPILVAVVMSPPLLPPQGFRKNANIEFLASPELWDVSLTNLKLRKSYSQIIGAQLNGQYYLSGAENHVAVHIDLGPCLILLVPQARSSSRVRFSHKNVCLWDRDTGEKIEGFPKNLGSKSELESIRQVFQRRPSEEAITVQNVGTSSQLET